MYQRVFNRFGRVALATILGVLTVYATDSPYAMVVVPLLSALGKWCREKGMIVMPL